MTLSLGEQPSKEMLASVSASPSPTLSTDDPELQKYFPLKNIRSDFKTLAPLLTDYPSNSSSEITVGIGTLLAKFIQGFRETNQFVHTGLFWNSLGTDAINGGFVASEYHTPGANAR